jgi:hypothetical protein
MAKLTIEFDMFEEKSEYQMALKGIDLVCALSDIGEELRRLDKYGDRETMKEFADADAMLDHIREAYYEILQKRDVQGVLNDA